MSPLASWKPSLTASPFPSPLLLQKAQGELGVCVDLASDDGFRVVGGVAFDEQEFAPVGQSWQVGDQRRDMSGFVPAGDHDTHGRFLLGTGERSGGTRASGDLEHQRQGMEGRHSSHVAIEKAGKQRDPNREDDVAFMADHLEIRQREHVLDLLGGQPGLGRLTEFESEHFRQPKERLPQPGVAEDQDPGAFVGNGMKPSERGLNVRQVRDHVGEQDDVEGPSCCGEDLGVSEVSFDERELRQRVTVPGSGYGARRDVDSDTLRRSERGQEVARSATEVEDSKPFRNPDPHDALEIVVVVRVPPSRLLDAFVPVLVERTDLLEERIRECRTGG